MDFQLYFLKEGTRVYEKADLITLLSATPNIKTPDMNAKTGKYVENAMPCAMCKRFIINSGITKMIFRDSKTKYREIDVQDLIDNDDSLNGTLGY